MSYDPLYDITLVGMTREIEVAHGWIEVSINQTMNGWSVHCPDRYDGATDAGNCSGNTLECADTIDNAIAAFIDVYNDNWIEEHTHICSTCSGSGEGMHPGSRCRSCGGSGEYRSED